MCAPRNKLIIEVDGSQHLDQEEYDAGRDWARHCRAPTG